MPVSARAPGLPWLSVAILNFSLSDQAFLHPSLPLANTLKATAQRKEWTPGGDGLTSWSPPIRRTWNFHFLISPPARRQRLPATFIIPLLSSISWIFSMKCSISHTVEPITFSSSVFFFFLFPQMPSFMMSCLLSDFCFSSWYLPICFLSDKVLQLLPSLSHLYTFHILLPSFRLVPILTGAAKSVIAKTNGHSSILMVFSFKDSVLLTFS